MAAGTFVAGRSLRLTHGGQRPLPNKALRALPGTPKGGIARKGPSNVAVSRRSRCAGLRRDRGTGECAGDAQSQALALFGYSNPGGGAAAPRPPPGGCPAQAGRGDFPIHTSFPRPLANKTKAPGVSRGPSAVYPSRRKGGPNQPERFLPPGSWLPPRPRGKACFLGMAQGRDYGDGTGRGYGLPQPVCGLASQ